ncbi:MAG: stage II sporulation protein M [Thermogutta sp.]
MAQVPDFLKQRMADWQELERICHVAARLTNRPTAEMVCRLSELYRAACADLALAEAQQSSPEVLDYLHRLVGQAHNVLYRHPQSLPRQWLRTIFIDVPATAVRDKMIWLSFAVFWGLFLLTGTLARQSESFAEAVVGQDTLDAIEQMYSRSLSDEYPTIVAVGFYIMHNVGIALECFATGALFVLPGLFVLVFNAVFLGTICGHMSQTGQAENFFQFVTGHGPFELTGICLAAGCGMRLGFSLLETGNLTRLASFRRAARQVAPVLLVACLFFVLAAVIEGLVSPSATPLEIKQWIAMVSAGALIAYFATGIFVKPNHG